MREIDVVGGAAGRELIVEERLLYHRARKRGGQLAARVRVAEENIGDSRAGLDAGIPCFKNRGDVFCCPLIASGRPSKSTSTVGLPIW